MTSHKALAGLLLLCAVVCLIGQAAPIPQPSGGPQKSRQELEKAAAQGDAEAKYQLGLLEQRAGLLTDGPPAALTWFREAARQGHAKAQYELGRFYYQCSAGRSFPLARKWLTLAAERGEAQAWLMLGRLYAEGGPGVPQDIAFARECYQKADAKGDREVWCSLGIMYQNGVGGVLPDWPKALDYSLKAAKQGHREAQYHVGQLYQYGIGTAPDLPKAIHWFKEAAGREDSSAEAKLGWLYEHGIGVEKNREQALAWYKKSEARDGLSVATLHLWRLDESAVMKRFPPDPPVPTTKDIEITLEPEKTEYELDDLIVVAVRLRNVGKESYSFEEGRTGGFRAPFSVKDDNGKAVPNPFADRGGVVLIVSYISSITVLKPGDSRVRSYTLNQCARFPKAGTYTITTGKWVYRGEDGRRADEKDRREIEAKPVTLTIRESDPDKRKKDIESLAKAYREGNGIPPGMTRPAEFFGGRLDVLRRLVFCNDPTLIPLFLDALEIDEGRDFAETGLRALPDRAAVIKAFEERFDYPEKYNTLELLYPCLRIAGVLNHDFDGEPDNLEKWKREVQITRKCKEKAIQLLRGDKRYQYARLVPGLLGGSDDLFLVEYLIRCKPGTDLVRKCARAIQRVNLGVEHIPFLQTLLDVPHDTYINDAAIVQLVRLDRARYLPRLKSDPKKFSPEIVKFFLEPPDE